MPHLHSVIPPYILRRIIESGSEPQQRYARQTLTHVQTLMAHMPGKPAAPHVNKAGQLERDIYDAKQTGYAGALRRPAFKRRCGGGRSLRLFGYYS